jgi:prophage regulatory protein
MSRLNIHAPVDPAPTTAPVPPLSPPALLLAARQAAALCGVSVATWWRWRAAGCCPAPVRVGGCVRWRAEELREWTKAGCPPRSEWEALRAAAQCNGRPRG